MKIRGPLLLRSRRRTGKRLEHGLTPHLFGAAIERLGFPVLPARFGQLARGAGDVALGRRGGISSVFRRYAQLRQPGLALLHIDIGLLEVAELDIEIDEVPIGIGEPVRRARSSSVTFDFVERLQSRGKIAGRIGLHAEELLEQAHLALPTEPSPYLSASFASETD